jgi:D-alanyl-D-alanine carboxypeptidase
MSLGERSISGCMKSLAATASAAAIAILALTSAPQALAVSANATRPADAQLQRALRKLVARRDGPPGVAVMLQRGKRASFSTAGVGEVGRRRRIAPSDHMRLASVAKAFSGAVVLSLVAEGKLSLDDTVGKWLPSLPSAWSAVTLRELLAHTSGIPDFSQTEAFGAALGKSLLLAPDFTPGSRYRYSNSDNIIAALIAAAAGHGSYEAELAQRVLAPLGLSGTSLPLGATMPKPYVHAYVVDPPKAPEDVSELFAAGWSWASGGVVSTPRDANAFVRAYVRGALTDAAAHAAQFTFLPCDLSLSHTLWHGLRAHGQYGRLHAVHRGERERHALDGRLGQRPDHAKGQRQAIRRTAQDLHARGVRRARLSARPENDQRVS